MKTFKFLLVFADGRTMTEHALASSAEVAAIMSEQMLMLFNADSVTAEAVS